MNLENGFKVIIIEVPKTYSCQRCGEVFRYYKDLYLEVGVSPFCSKKCEKEQVILLYKIWYSELQKFQWKQGFKNSKSDLGGQGAGQKQVQKNVVQRSYMNVELWTVDPKPYFGLNELEPDFSLTYKKPLPLFRVELLEVENDF